MGFLHLISKALSREQTNLNWLFNLYTNDNNGNHTNVSELTFQYEIIQLFKHSKSQHSLKKAHEAACQYSFISNCTLANYEIKVQCTISSR